MIDNNSRLSAMHSNGDRKHPYVRAEGEFTSRHRLWLDRAELLRRPWFFLASAPKPTIPDDLPPDVAYVYIKYAALEGRRLGLPAPDLIYVNDDSRIADQTEGLACRRILSLTRQHRKIVIDRLRSRMPVLSQQFMRISGVERDWAVNAILGDSFVGVGSKRDPSNGIALICYALLLGVPKIIVAGMSLTDDGHTNPNRTKNHRMHKEEDYVSFLQFAQRFPAVMTSEPELSELTGLPLFSGSKKATARPFAQAVPASSADARR